MKKFFYGSIALAMIFIGSNVFAMSNTYYTNNSSISMTQQEYNNLLNLGFNAEQIERMDINTFNDNKDIEATLVASNTKYYKTITSTTNGITSYTNVEVSENEYNSANKVIQTRHNPAAIIETAYKRMTTSIYEMLPEFRYRVDLYWKNIPSKRSFDIIGIGMQAYNVVLNSGLSLRTDWTYSNGSTGYDNMGACVIEEDTGCGMSFELPTGSLSALSTYLYYDVYKRYLNETVTSLVATGDYAHATSTVSIYNSQRFSVNHINGIELEDAIAGSYDTTPKADVQWYGTW